MLLHRKLLNGCADVRRGVSPRSSDRSVSAACVALCRPPSADDRLCQLHRQLHQRHRPLPKHVFPVCIAL